jgi:COX assembly mitochondrial protein 2
MSLAAVAAFTASYMCSQEILGLQQCHDEHPVAKFWGVCNGAKLALDECFRREKIIKR